MSMSSGQITDREARAVIERVLAKAKDGDHYGAIDEVVSVYCQGKQAGTAAQSQSTFDALEEAGALA